MNSEYILKYIETEKHWELISVDNLRFYPFQALSSAMRYLKRLEPDVEMFLIEVEEQK